MTIVSSPRVPDVNLIKAWPGSVESSVANDTSSVKVTGPAPSPAISTVFTRLVPVALPCTSVEKPPRLPRLVTTFIYEAAVSHSSVIAFLFLPRVVPLIVRPWESGPGKLPVTAAGSPVHDSSRVPGSRTTEPMTSVLVATESL